MFSTVQLHEGDRQIVLELLSGINRIADALEKQTSAPPPVVVPATENPIFPDINVGWLGASLDPNHPCTNCSNAPHKGGSGICNCTLPYFYENTQPPPMAVPLYQGWRMGVNPDGYRVSGNGYVERVTEPMTKTVGKTWIGEAIDADIGMFPHDLTPGLH